MTTAKTKDSESLFEAALEPPRGRGRPQIRSDEQTRALIFEAARSEFAQAGYAATSMESVARRAGVSTKTLYRLVPNKAALFEAMITDRIDRFVSIVNLGTCKGDVAAALTEALIICGELLLNAEVLTMQRMILGDSDKFPEIAETFYHKAIRRTEDTLADWLRRQQKRGAIALADAQGAAGMLLGMLAFQPQRAMLFGRKAPLSRQEIEQRARACATLFLQGCRH
jgi:AcrR family transcriptional regulator